MRIYDLHLHSTASDGDQTPTEVIAAAAQRGVVGVSLTDHNGLWGLVEAREAADQHNLSFIEGIEINTLWQGWDVHLLGYSRQFIRPLLTAGLAATREGAAGRVQAMAEACQRLGFTGVTFESIRARRAHLVNPSYLSYDVARVLHEEHGVDPKEAWRMTVRGGQCHVPYGDWALSPPAGAALIQEAQGRAILAHPGTIAHEAGPQKLWELLGQLAAAGLGGLEVWHPFHTPDLVYELMAFAQKHRLVMTGGSDWHGLGRYDDTALGRVGMREAAWEAFEAALLSQA
jgi:predicted metal-dependent phosphoesterase TrpH